MINKKINLKKTEIVELKNRLLFFIFSLIVYRIGLFIPIPGIDFVLKKKENNSIIGLLNIFTGFSVNRTSIFTLGMMPYILSSIIIQLLSLIMSYFSSLKKEGEYGKYKINKYIRYITLIISIFQAIGIAISINNIKLIKKLINKNVFYLTTVISLVTGTIFLMWLCEKINENGIGNGISNIIYSGIAAEIPKTILNSISKITNNKKNFCYLLILILLIFLLIYFVVFIEYGQRKIFVSYAKTKKINSFYYIKNKTHLPLKINIVGVIPTIFAYSIMLLITKIIFLILNIIKNSNLYLFAILLQPNKPLYILLYIILIIFFCFFYKKIIFSPIEIANNLKKSCAFLHGIRPGEQTAKYINLVSNRLAFFGAIYIIFINLIPEFIIKIINFPFNFGGTSLLIVVITIIDYLNQINNLLLSNKYELFLIK